LVADTSAGRIESHCRKYLNVKVTSSIPVNGTNYSFKNKKAAIIEAFLFMPEVVDQSTASGLGYCTLNGPSRL
jgi:hypothetical protein